MGSWTMTKAPTYCYNNNNNSKYTRHYRNAIIDGEKVSTMYLLTQGTFCPKRMRQACILTKSAIGFFIQAKLKRPWILESNPGLPNFSMTGTCASHYGSLECPPSSLHWQCMAPTQAVLAAHGPCCCVGAQALLNPAPATECNPHSMQLHRRCKETSPLFACGSRRGFFQGPHMCINFTGHM